MKVTKTIHRHPALFVSWDQGKESRKLKVRAPVTKDTLLLVEHCLSGSADQVALGIAADCSLFDALAPRGVVDRTKREGLAKAKVNAFASPVAKEWVVGRVISATSHSCKPNCIATFVLHDIKSPDSMLLPCDCMFLYTIEDVDAGEELTIAYATRSQIHSEAVAGFKCECDTPPNTPYQAPMSDRPDALKIVFGYLDDNRRSTKTIANIMLVRDMADEFGDDEPVTNTPSV